MKFSEQIAMHLRQVYFGGNWTVTNFKDVLTDVTHEEAHRKVDDFNTIATLTFHTNYFIKTINRVLAGEPLSGNDKLSFKHPKFESEKEWSTFVKSTFDDAKQLESLIKELQDNKLLEEFTDKKYGLYNRNLWGVIEHCHYHLGQMVILKKLIRKDKKP